MRPVIGVLALQGDFEAHARAIADSGARFREIRRVDQLEGVEGLVLPGGESTTLLRLIREYGFDEALPRFVREGGAIYGTCAGAILLAHEVTSPSQWSMDLIDVTVQRNGYGRQAESFETILRDVDDEILGMDRDAASPGRTLDVLHANHPQAEDAKKTAGLDREVVTPLPAVFIRAPRILRVGPAATVLASHDGEPVVVREGRILVSTFHPEMTPDRRLHRYFLDRVIAPQPFPSRVLSREG